MESSKEGRKTSLRQDIYDTSSMQHLVSEYIKELLNINKTRINNLIENGQRKKMRLLRKEEIQE